MVIVIVISKNNKKVKIIENFPTAPSNRSIKYIWYPVYDIPYI